MEGSSSRQRLHRLFGAAALPEPSSKSMHLAAVGESSATLLHPSPLTAAGVSIGKEEEPSARVLSLCCTPPLPLQQAFQQGRRKGRVAAE